MDVEGIAPAKLYYERFGVTFPALVAPNYATGFGGVPLTFFVNQLGVVQKLSDWENRLKPVADLKPVTDEVRKLWTAPNQRLNPAAIAQLVAKHDKNPKDLGTAAEIASRYLELNLLTEAKTVLQETIKHYDARKVAQADEGSLPKLLGQAYLQLSRASVGDREAQVKFATLSYYLNPSIGFGKQIARVIAPEKFDGRPRGDFDNRFREATLRRLRRERKDWLAGE
jgi:hypothetical protein